MMRVSNEIKKVKKVKVYKLELAFIGLAAYILYRGLMG